MSLANIFLPPRTGENQDVWSFSNMDNHRLIVDQIRIQLQINLQNRQLDPMPTDFNFDFWLQKHQQSHNDFTSILGIDGADFTELDFKNQRDVDSWTFLHASEHRLANQILGV